MLRFPFLHLLCFGVCIMEQRTHPIPSLPLSQSRDQPFPLNAQCNMMISDWQHNFRDVNELSVDDAGWWRQYTIIAALLSNMYYISGKFTKTKCCNCKIMEKFQKKMEKNMQNLILCKIHLKLISVFICSRCASALLRAFAGKQLKFCSAYWNGSVLNLIFGEL